MSKSKLPKSERRRLANKILDNCKRINSTRSQTDPKVVKWRHHQNLLRSHYARRYTEKMNTKYIVDLRRHQTFEDPDSPRKLGKAVEANIIASDDRMVFKDSSNSLVHGQLLVPESHALKITSVAGDHGCGASVFDLPKNFNLDTFKKRCTTLPTGGNTWEKQFNSNLVSQVRSLPFPSSARPIIDHHNLYDRIGSLGSGNHFVHVVRRGKKQKLVVHTGSRGMAVQTIPQWSETEGLSYNRTYRTFLRQSEKFAEMNREAIANYLVNGSLTTDYPLPHDHYTHTRIDTSLGFPLIQKNVTRTRKDGRNLVLGSPSSGVSFVNPIDDPFYIHGSGPRFGEKGQFRSVEEVGGEQWHSVFNFDRHSSAGGHSFIGPDDD
jgi:hypothetical protein